MYELINPFKADKVSLKETAIKGVKEGLLPVLIQFGVLLLVILEFNYLIGSKNGARLIEPSVLVGGVATNPNIVRFIYLFLSLAGAFVMAYFAAKNAEREVKAFWLGLIGGILLWQSIGECAWHFGYYVGGHYVGFPQIEGASGTFILICVIALLAYTQKKGAFDWGTGAFVLSFMCNWIGHFVMEGTFPWVASAITEPDWFKVVGLVLGIPALFASAYLMFFAAKNKKGRLISSLLMYTALGMIASGVLGI